MVSELCLGCMTFGRELDEAGSRELVDHFISSGGNFIDTADVYSSGVSERITGVAIKGVREDVVLATKVYFPTGEGVNDAGLSRKHIMRACEESLRRLGTEYIDLYQVHCWDSVTPLDETLSALTELVHQGKVPTTPVFTGGAEHRVRDLAGLSGGGFRSNPMEPPRGRFHVGQVPPWRGAAGGLPHSRGGRVDGRVLGQASDRAQLADA
jgi:aryl-alcohol dehydrogenase-like predicted oxidoreductase